LAIEGEVPTNTSSWKDSTLVFYVIDMPSTGFRRKRERERGGEGEREREREREAERERRREKIMYDEQESKKKSSFCG
jgi:hypothetical protein